MSHTILAVGAELRVGRVLAVPPPPANYKKAETIAAWQAEKAAEMEGVSAFVPTAGVVGKWAVYRGNGRLADSGVGGCDLASAVLALLPGEYNDLSVDNPTGAVAGDARPVTVFGFGIADALRVAAAECWAAGEGVPSWFYRGGPPLLVDPYHAMIPADARRYVSAADVVAHCTLADGEAPVPGRGDVSDDAVAALYLAKHARLAPFPV